MRPSLATAAVSGLGLRTANASAASRAASTCLRSVGSSSSNSAKQQQRFFSQTRLSALPKASSPRSVAESSTLKAAGSAVANAAAAAVGATSESFDPNAPTAMDKQQPPAPGADFNVVIVGAGNINFGSDEGPWNHSFRLEHKLGPRLKVTALIDPSAARADQALTVKRNSFVLSAYKDTIVYPTFEAYLADPKQKEHQPQ